MYAARSTSLPSLAIRLLFGGSGVVSRYVPTIATTLRTAGRHGAVGFVAERDPDPPGVPAHRADGAHRHQKAVHAEGTAGVDGEVANRPPIRIDQEIAEVAEVAVVALDGVVAERPCAPEVSVGRRLPRGRGQLVPA